jgi:hypothetical protein
MLRNRRAAIALAALIGVAVVANIVSQPPPKSPNDKQQGGQQSYELTGVTPNFVPFKLFTDNGRTEIANYCAENSESKTNDWSHKYVCDARIADAYIAFFGLLLVIVTGGLVWIGYMQIRTARAQLRAYVFVDVIRITHVGDGDGIPEAQVYIKNCGQTPAYQCRGVGGFAISPFFPPPPDLDLSVTDDRFAQAKTKSVILPAPRLIAPSAKKKGRHCPVDISQSISMGGSNIVTFSGMLSGPPIVS